MRAVTLVLLLSLVGCFPHNRKHAKIAEGGAIAAGIAMLAVTGTGADCSGGLADHAALEDCHARADITGGIGLGLILAGLVGFVVTVSTDPGEQAKPMPASATAKVPASAPAASRPAGARALR